MTIEIYEKIMGGALILLVVFAGVFLIRVSEKRDKELMKIHYCFRELADGSIYHYVCEKE